MGRPEAEGALGKRAFEQSFKDDLVSISQNEYETSKNVRWGDQEPERCCKEKKRWLGIEKSYQKWKEKIK